MRRAMPLLSLLVVLIVGLAAIWYGGDENARTRDFGLAAVFGTILLAAGWVFDNEAERRQIDRHKGGLAAIAALHEDVRHYAKENANRSSTPSVMLLALLCLAVRLAARRTS